MTENNDLSLLAGAYALGALSAEDARRYENYLANREEARTEATQLEDTAALLGLASVAVQPSPALKSNLMAMIATTPQLPAVVPVDAPADGSAQQVAAHEQEALPDGSTVSAPTLQSAPDAPATERLSASAPITDALAAQVAGKTASETPAAAPARSDAAAPVTPAPATPAPATPAGRVPAATPRAAGAAQTKAQARWFRKPVAFLAAAAALVVAFVGASALTGALNNGNQVQQALALASINAQPDVRRSTVPLLANDNGHNSSTATLVWSENLGQSVIVVNGLEQLPGDQTYELWYIDGENAPVSAGLFDIPSSGHTYSVLDGEMTAGATVGVTVEPAGGSEQPTSDPVIAIPTA